MEPLIFSSISNPIIAFKSFNIDNICNLVEISYSQDFIKKKKKGHMRLQLYHYDFDLSNMDEILQKIYILKRKL